MIDSTTSTIDLVKYKHNLLVFGLAILRNKTNKLSINFQLMGMKKCALCDNEVPTSSMTSLCINCLRYADCCVGLEKTEDKLE